MSNMTRASENFESEWLNEVPETGENQEVTVTQQELKQIFEKCNLSGKQILNIDKKVFEKLEAYMKQVERLNEYKRKIARQELQKYIVPIEKVKNTEDCVRTTFFKVYINKQKIGTLTFYSSYRGTSFSKDFNIITFRDFKYLIAGTEYSYLSDAFLETDEDSKNEIYIDAYFWMLEKGMRVETGRTWATDEQFCKITFPRK